jgi:hypothetical protein
METELCMETRVVVIILSLLFDQVPGSRLEGVAFRKGI